MIAVASSLCRTVFLINVRVSSMIPVMCRPASVDGSCVLFDFEARVLDELAPLCDLGLNEITPRFCGRRLYLDAGSGELVDDVRQREYTHGLRIELTHNV